VDLLGVVTVVSLLRNKVGPRVFRAVHWATYALWPVALAHSLGTGTDAGTLWFRVLAGTCTAAVLAALTWRTSRGYVERGRDRLPRVTDRKVAAR
jgi:sulfoxide reductase heme-binding subunit YedZ